MQSKLTNPGGGGAVYLQVGDAVHSAIDLNGPEPSLTSVHFPSFGESHLNVGGGGGGGGGGGDEGIHFTPPSLPSGIHIPSIPQRKKPVQLCSLPGHVALKP